MEKTVAGIRELKAHLSNYLREVEAGKEIVITRHGEPVGIIVPARREEKPVGERLEALRQAGVIEWSGKKPPSRDIVAEVNGNRTVSDLLLEDRR